jgi:hypothetical protein
VLWLAQGQRADSAPGRARTRCAPAIVAPVLLCVAYGILLLCWGGANPPFAAPDELSRYLRALGLSGGHLLTDTDKAGGGTPAPWAAE